MADTHPRGKALLVFPPQWSPQNPHFSSRALMGHLRARGHEVAVRDLNVTYYDTVLSPGYLRRTRDLVRLDHDFLRRDLALAAILDDLGPETERKIQRYHAYRRYMEQKEDLLDLLPDQIQDACETMRDPRRFYNPDLLVEALYTINEALELVALPHYPASLSFHYFHQPGNLFEVASLIELASDETNNLFYRFFAEQLPDLLAEGADWIGVSINAFSQVVPGLTLARLLRRAAPPGVHVSIGGNFFARVQDALVAHPEFFRTFAHSVLAGEGEEQLCLLLEALKSGAPLETVPSMLYLDEATDQVRVTPHRPAIRMDDAGLQDLAGLPLDRYFTPELVLTIQASKGCYWGKCTFCDTDFGIQTDTKRLDHLVAEIRHLRDTYGVRHFQFIDEAIRPTYMRQMAERFIAEELDIAWFCNARLDRAITPDLLELLARAGLRMVLWGFESGSQRVLDLMKKGIDAEGRYDLLRAADAVGIWNFAYIFFGFPTETVAEATSTIDAICAHTDIVHSYGRSIFTLGKQAPLYQDAAELGIVDVMEDKEELSTNLHYRVNQGMQPDELEQVIKECTRRCGEAYRYNLWFFLRYRENIHLYVARFGLPFVKDYTMVRFVNPSPQGVSF